MMMLLLNMRKLKNGMPNPEPIHIISLGAGVQSSTMALMAAKGEITPMPTAAIFADTQAEPKAVYTWLDWLEKQFPFPVYRVTRGSLWQESIKIRRSKKSNKLYMKGAIPAFTKQPDGKIGLLARQCTADFKIAVLTRKTRTLCDWKRGETRDLIRLWIGISYDELIRMKPSKEKWIQHIWPLVDMRITREGCLKWMKQNHFPEPPRSACVFCPFHSDEEWYRLKTKEPEEFDRAVKYEQDLQNAAKSQEVLTGFPFLHDECVPIDQIDFCKTQKPAHRQVSLFGNECEGMCGV